MLSSHVSFHLREWNEVCGKRSGKYGGWGTGVMPFLVKNRRTERAMCAEAYREGCVSRGIQRGLCEQRHTERAVWVEAYREGCVRRGVQRGLSEQRRTERAVWAEIRLFLSELLRNSFITFQTSTTSWSVVHFLWRFRDFCDISVGSGRRRLPRARLSSIDNFYLFWNKLDTRSLVFFHSVIVVAIFNISGVSLQEFNRSLIYQEFHSRSLTGV